MRPGLTELVIIMSIMMMLAVPIGVFAVIFLARYIKSEPCPKCQRRVKASFRACPHCAHQLAR